MRTSCSAAIPCSIRAWAAPTCRAATRTRSTRACAAWRTWRRAPASIPATARTRRLRIRAGCCGWDWGYLAAGTRSRREETRMADERMRLMALVRAESRVGHAEHDGPALQAVHRRQRVVPGEHLVPVRLPGLYRRGALHRPHRRRGLRRRPTGSTWKTTSSPASWAGCAPGPASRPAAAGGWTSPSPSAGSSAWPRTTAPSSTPGRARRAPSRRRWPWSAPARRASPPPATWPSWATASRSTRRCQWRAACSPSGIPEWRLPRDLCNEEIDQYLAALGVEIKAQHADRHDHHARVDRRAASRTPSR